MSDEESTEVLDTSFEAAKSAIDKTPGSTDAWEHLEEFAESHGYEHHIADVYRDHLSRRPDKATFDLIARRAVVFFDEWFGDDPERLQALLGLIIENDSDTRWAFNRLTELLSSGGDWTALFVAYDGMLERNLDDSTKRELLEEASDIARDLAGMPDKALTYLIALHKVDKQNTERLSAITRMLEKENRWEELIDLLRSQIEIMSGEAIPETKTKIVEYFINKLTNFERAISELQTLFTEHPAYLPACHQAEEILNSEDAEHGMRTRALEMLITNYNAAHKYEELVNALNTAIAFAEGDEKISLYRKVGSRLAMMGKAELAIDAYASVLKLDPSDSDALRHLRILSVKAKRADLRAQALVDAATNCEDETLEITLLSDAAALFASDDVNNPETAARIYRELLQKENLEKGVLLKLAYCLNELLTASGEEEERLGVLEMIAENEQTAIVRRTVFQQAAQVAADLNLPERAIAYWKALLSENDNDFEALSEVIVLLNKMEQWDNLVIYLQRRADRTLHQEQKREDLVAIAKIQETQLENPAAAILTWRRVFDDFGPREDAVSKLDELLNTAGQYTDLVDILRRATDGEHIKLQETFNRLAQIYADELDDNAHALRYYKYVLSLSPENEVARNGMMSLAQSDDESKPLAIRLIATAFESTGDWEKLSDLLAQRLEVAQDEFEAKKIMENTAAIYHHQLKDTERALKLYCKILPLAPSDSDIFSRIVNLAGSQEHYELASQAMLDAADNCQQGSNTQMFLLKQAGDILENRLDKSEEALKAFVEIEKHTPSDAAINDAVMRLASTTGNIAQGVWAFLLQTRNQASLDEEALFMLENAARTNAEEAHFANSMADGLTGTLKLQPTIAAALLLRLGDWYLQHVNDGARAKEMFALAVDTEPASTKALRKLASLQVETKDLDYVKTLQSIYKLKPDNIDPLLEAAKVAVDELDTYEDKRKVVVELYNEAIKQWRLGTKMTGEVAPAECVLQANTQIAQLDLENNQPERAAQILLDGSKLPFDNNRSCFMLSRAATIFEDIGMNAVAIDCYNQILSRQKDDAETIGNLDRLLEQENRLVELLAIRQLRLELAEGDEEKLAMRLNIAELSGQLEGKSNRLELLRANLNADPVHGPSIDAIQHILEQRMQHETLASLFDDHAAKLVELEHDDAAAHILKIVARLYHKNLDSPDKALSAYTRLSELEESIETLEALSKLLTQKGDFPGACDILQRKLNICSEEERVPTMIRLARTKLKIDDKKAARKVLEEAFKQMPQNAEVRKLLLDRYRESNKYDKLAETIITAIDYIKDPVTLLAYAREAADLHFDKLGTPGAATKVLQIIVEKDKDDQDARMRLADALIENGENEDAKSILEEILDGFGRRRNAKRAAIHARLATVNRSMDNMEEALSHMTQAAQMDNHNLAFSSTLAEMAKAAGEMDLAEKTYRSLLMTVRRARDGESDFGIGAPQILIELGWLARQKGDEDNCKELHESALEALSSADKHFDALEALLTVQEEWALLEQVYNRRLQFLESDLLKAQTLDGLAKLYEGPLDDKDEAFNTRIKALKAAPGIPDFHDRAVQLAEAADRYNEYVKALEELLEKTRRDSDALTRCEILLRLVNVRIQQNNDLEAAVDFFAEAEKLNVREVDVMKTGSQLAEARGDKEEQVRLLQVLANLGAGESDAQEDAMFRLAEINLAAEETYAKGREQLLEAFEESQNSDRAGMILARLERNICEDTEMLQLYEQIARASEDDEMLLKYFEQYSESPSANPAQIKEGAALAIKMEHSDRAEELLGRMIKAGEEFPEYADAISWAMLRLGSIKLAAGEAAAAVKWLLEAAEILPDDEVFEFGIELAGHIKTENRDYVLASKVYKRLLELKPDNADVLDSLSDIYIELDDTEGFETMVEEAMYAVESPSVRNGIRLKWVQMLMKQQGREQDAEDVLKNVLMEEPGNEVALGILSDYYIRENKKDELLELLTERFENALTDNAMEEIKGIALILGSHTDEEDAVKEVYRRALNKVPDDLDLLKALIGCLQGEDNATEKLALLEKTLQFESAERIPELTLEIANTYREMGDNEGASRSLKSGYAQAPDNQALKSALETDYRDKDDFAGLVGFLEDNAAKLEAPDKQVTAWLEIADHCRDSLNDVGRELNALGHIQEQLGNQADYVQRVIDANRRAGHLEAAIEQTETAIAATEDDQAQLQYLKLLAQLHGENASEELALETLDKAAEIDADAVTDDIEQMLLALKQKAAENDDEGAEKAAVARLTALYSDNEREDELHALLTGWLQKSTEDVESWRILLKLEQGIANWTGVIEACKKLTVLTEADEQLEIGRILLEACKKAGTLEIARRGLEYIYKENIDGTSLRQQLKEVYGLMGAYYELATFLAHDARECEDPAEKAELFRKAGDAYLKAEDPDTALLALKESLALDPENQESVILVVDISIEQGALEEAESKLDAAIEHVGKKRTPLAAALKYRKAKIVGLQGDRSTQLALLEEASQANRTDGVIVAELAELAEQLEEWDMATKALRNIALMKDECPISKGESFMRQGRIAHQQGDDKKAVLYLKKALQENGDYPEAQALLDEIS